MASECHLCMVRGQHTLGLSSRAHGTHARTRAQAQGEHTESATLPSFEPPTAFHRYVHTRRVKQGKG